MEIKSLFNILLLSLSLATLLITLVSYLLYKIRQIALKNQRVDLAKIEGFFFKRYAPHLERLNQEAKLKGRKKFRSVKLGTSLGYLMLIVTLIIFSVFIIENYSNDRKLQKKRMAVAESYRELLDKGFMRRYDFDAGFKVSQLRESYRQEAVHQKIRFLSSQLLSKKITLIEIDRNLEFNKEAYERSVKRWLDWATRVGVSLNRVKGIELAGQTDFIILPQAKALNQIEKSWLSERVAAGVGLLATGAVSALDGKGGKDNGDWLKSHFEMNFSTVSTDRWPRNWILSGDEAAEVGLPRGLVFDFSALDKSLTAWSTTTKPDHLLPARFDGQMLAGPWMVSAKTNPRGSVFWSAFDPLETILDSADMTQGQADDEKLRFAPYESYQDLFFLSKISKSLKLRNYLVEPWPNGAQFSFSVNFSANDDLDTLKSEVKSLSDLKVKPTLFIAPDDLKNSVEGLGDLSKNLDIGISLPQAQMGELRNSKVAFEFFEKLRLDYEGAFSKEVSGVQFQSNRFTPEALSGFLQNHFRYALADAGMTRLEPVWIADSWGSQLFSAVISSDQELFDRRSVGNEQQWMGELKREWDRIRSAGGWFSFRLTSEIQAKKIYQRSTDEFIKGVLGAKPWVASLREISDWITVRDAIRVDWGHALVAGKQFEVKLENSSGLPAEGVVVNLMDPELAKLADPKTWRVNFSELDSKITLATVAGGLRVLISKMDAKEVLNLQYQGKAQ